MTFSCKLLKCLKGWTILTLLLISFPSFSQTSQEDVDYVQVSIDLLEAIKSNEDFSSFVSLLSESSIESLNKSLGSNKEKLAFWVNVYNSYIQIKLRENPEDYEDRGVFFKKKFISIGGVNMSFADIEHGIIRRSRFEYFLGFIQNPFPPKYECKLRVDDRDFRVHFALNCGAKSCPPIAVYTPDKLDRQFDFMTREYLHMVSTFDKDKNVVMTTPLFSWFVGDFGDRKGIKRILFEYGVTPSEKVEIETTGYDWTLDLGNFKELPF